MTQPKTTAAEYHCPTLSEMRAEYDRLDGWRRRWTALMMHREPNRTQSRADRIARRASIANQRIGSLLRRFGQ